MIATAMARTKGGVGVIFALVVLLFIPGPLPAAGGEGENAGEPLSFEWVMEHGDQFQQENLCVRYALGDGVPLDYDKAHALCLRSMQECYGQAAIVLSFLYEEGHGVRKDLAAALGWHYLINTDVKAEEILATRRKLEKALSPEERAGALKFACEWEKKYCEIVTLQGCE